MRYVLLSVILGLFLILAGCGRPGAETLEATGTSQPGSGELDLSTSTPQSAEAWFQRGNEQFASGDLDGAEQAYKQALELNPDYVDAMTNLGVVYYQKGRLDEAVAWYEKALKVNPDDPVAHYLLGAAYLQEGALDQAEQHFVRANELDPEMPEPYFGLGMVHKLRGEKEEAIQAFEMFLQKGPGQDPRAVPEAQRQLQELRGR